MAANAQRNLTLALQGGGTHGAFTWGVLDRLLEDPRINITAISGTSAGAMNAAVLVDGLQENGREGAREHLHAFWATMSRYGSFSPFGALARHGSGLSPWTLWLETLSRMASPYDVNPFNVDPLRRVLERTIDFSRLRCCSSVQLFISATNVQRGTLRVFTTDEISADVLLASACLPRIHHAVKIGDQHYWDGGFMGNPVLEPLLTGCDASDVLIVQINPTHRERLPRSADAIEDRLNEITFNASLMREIRSIAHLNRLVEEGWADPGHLSRVFLHLVGAEEATSGLGHRSKLDTSWRFLTRLRDAGRDKAEAFLAEHFDALGHESTLALEPWRTRYALPERGGAPRGPA